jgi:hypothetical protein
MGMSRWKVYVNLPTEPIAAVLGAFAVTFFHQPHALAFAAGAMVVEVIPERNRIIMDIAMMDLLGIYCYDGLGCSWLELLWDK